MRTNHAKKTINDDQRSTRVEIMNAKSMFTSSLRAVKSIKNKVKLRGVNCKVHIASFKLRVCNQIIEDARRIMQMVKGSKDTN